MDEIWAHDQDQLRDPQRRWMRHTYQEGPGFRFLATRGGRPPAQRESKGALAVVRHRARLVRLARELGVTAALELGVCSRTSLWRWQCAYERGGLAALVPERRGPRHPTFRHPPWVEQVVIAVRLHTYWNAKRISAELRRREIAQVGHRWIEQLFDDLGASRPSGPRERGPRYERSSVNSLWHIDIKGPFFIQLGRDRRYLKTWIFGLVDDHSRYVLGLRVATTRQVAPILDWLRDCIELCGRPLDLMTDNGGEFVHWMPGCSTVSARRCASLRSARSRLRSTRLGRMGRSNRSGRRSRAMSSTDRSSARSRTPRPPLRTLPAITTTTVCTARSAG